jgi:biopolymer transport protein ExbD
VAFKKFKHPKNQIELVSFIDMIFILLVFFLLTNFVVNTSFEEKRMFIPTPKNELGRSQIVLQMMDQGRFLWLDETASAAVSDLENQYSYLPSEQLTKIVINALVERNVFSADELDGKIGRIVELANRNPQAAYFVLIRVPGGLPYFNVVDVISALGNTQYQNIRYGCISGTIEQLEKSRDIRTVLVEDKQGNRKKNLRIEF